MNVPDLANSRHRLGAVVVVTVHATALAGLLLVPATPASLLAMVGLAYLTSALGICVGYHRLLTHRGFEVPKWFEYALAMLGQLAWQGDPIEWVATHRRHHFQADIEGDPHSPCSGFWWSHVGWLLFRNDARPGSVDEALLAPDLVADGFYAKTR